MINKLVNNIKTNKYIKVFLIILLFNILPLIFVYGGLVYLNVMKIRTEDLESNIKEELQERTILEKQMILHDLEKELLTYIDNSDYDTEITRLNNLINEITEENKIINNKIEENNSIISNLQNNNNILKTKYQEVSNHRIPNIITINQYPMHPNGCEAVALTILLHYYGINVSTQNVMDALPKGDVPHYENGILYGGNPNYEFLGDPNSYYGWGIWDQGLAITANKFKSPIINGTGMDFRDVIKLVKNNRPVVVWTSIDLRSPHVWNSWIYKPTGERITWKNYNHAVVVIGYTENTVIISDPINGQIRSMDRRKFIDVYNYMGRKALYY